MSAITHFQQQLILKLILGQYFQDQLECPKLLADQFSDFNNTLMLNSEWSLIQWSGQQPEHADLTEYQVQAPLTEDAYTVMPLDWQKLLTHLFNRTRGNISEEIFIPLEYILNIAIKKQWFIAPHQLHYFIKTNKLSATQLSYILPQRCYQCSDLKSNRRLKLAQLIDQARRGASQQQIQTLLQEIPSIDLISLVYSRSIWPFFKTYLAEYWQQLRTVDQTKFLSNVQHPYQFFAEHTDLLTLPQHQFLYYINDSTHDIYQRYIDLVKQILSYDHAKRCLLIELLPQQHTELNTLRTFLPNVNFAEVKKAEHSILNELLEPLPLMAWLEIFPSWESIYTLEERQFECVLKLLNHRIFIEQDQQRASCLLQHLSSFPESVAGWFDFGALSTLSPTEQHNFFRLRLEKLLTREHLKRPVLTTHIPKQPLSQADTTSIVEWLEDEKNEVSSHMKQYVFSWLSLYGTGLDPSHLTQANQYIAATLNRLQTQ